MSLPIDNPGAMLLFVDGQQVTEPDLERIGSLAHQSIYHPFARVLQDAAGAPVSGFPGDDCKVSASGLTATIAKGWGFQYDSSASATWGLSYKPIVLSVAATQAITAHDATYERWDLIAIKANTSDDEAAVVAVKDLTSGVWSAPSTVRRRRFGYTISYTAGTPAATPSDPATPSGYIAIARIRVPAVSGAVSVDDLRPRVAVGEDFASEPPEEYAANFVPGSSSELAVTQNATPSMHVIVADGEAVIQGRRYRYGRTRIAITAAHATLDRTDTIVADNDGTVKVLDGTAGAGPASVAADQITLATVAVAATVTTIVTANITDTRERKPIVGTSQIRDATITAPKMYANAKPLKVSMTAGSDAGTTVAVDIQVQDAHGTAVAGAFDIDFDLRASNMEPVAPANWRLSETGAGSLISGANGTRAIVRTNGSGAAQVTVTDVVGGVAATLYLLARVTGYPACETYETVTFT